MNRPFQPEDSRTRRDPSGAGQKDTRPESRGEAGPRLALLSIVGFWLVYFTLATARSMVSDMPAQDEMLLRRAIVTLVAMGLTGLLYLLLRRFEQARTGRLLTIAFAASVPLAFAYATVNYIAFYGFPIAEQMEFLIEEGKYQIHDEPLSLITASALEWYFFIAAWAVMWVALLYAAKVRAVEREAARYARAAQDAELRALRYQVNPHFLFNTLNSLSSLVMRARGDEAERMILNLSTFFRASLTREASENVPLAEEVRLQLLYLDIEKVRFPERLVVKVQVPQALEDALVPALILQPLVENAIKYGVSRSQQPVTVTIAADAIGGRLELSVRDDGTSLPTEAEGGCGVGLGNVTARLKATYGDAASCVAGPATLASGTIGGWTVRLSMPLIRG